MIDQFHHEFKGFNRVPSRCLVKIFSDDGDHFICFEDINEGTSVTNASEQLASEIVNKMNYNPEDCQFFETYQQYEYDTFDEIKYSWEFNIGDEWKASNPKWIPANEFKNTFIE
jgi:hypothetical protein